MNQMAPTRGRDPYLDMMEEGFRILAPPPPATEAMRWTRADELRRAREMQASRFAVAPGCSIRLPSGRELHAGARITPEDLGDGERLQVLIDRHIVLRADAPEPEGMSPRYVVAIRGSLLTVRRGPVAHGRAVSSQDFAREEVPEVPAVAGEIRADGLVVRPRAAIPAQPAIDGSEVLARLVAEGKVTDTEANEPRRRKAS